MERDFLGMNRKDSMALGKEESLGSRQDSAFFGGSAVQWPFSNKISAVQKFMSFKAAQEERSKKIILNQISSSGFQSLSTLDVSDTNHKSAHVLAPQKYFNLDRQGVHQFPIHSYPSQCSDSFGASTYHLNEARTFPVSSHHSFPVAVSSPYFKVSGSVNGPNPAVTSIKHQQTFGGTAVTAPAVGSITGSLAPRNISKPSAPTAQLTIFYAGSVNVYDDVPLDKAQAIMFLASNGSKLASNSANTRDSAHVLAPTKAAGIDGISTNQVQTQAQIHVTSTPCSGLSSPISVPSHAGAHSGSGSSITDDLSGAKTVGPMAPTIQHEPLGTISTTVGSATASSLMSRAVPQARKASLTRFLEKRKERVTNSMPYACSKKSPERASGLEGLDSLSNLSADIVLSSNSVQLWRMGQPKSSPGCEQPPSTKLGM